MRDVVEIVAHVIREHRERFKRSDHQQLDGDHWLTSKETGLLALLVCDIIEALDETQTGAAARFSKEAHPRREKYIDSKTL